MSRRVVMVAPGAKSWLSGPIRVPRQNVRTISSSSWLLMSRRIVGERAVSHSQVSNEILARFSRSWTGNSKISPHQQARGPAGGISHRTDRDPF